MDIIKFRNEILNNSKPRQTKISNSYGVCDYFKYYKQIKPKDTQYNINIKQFCTIIGLINQMLADSIVNGHELEFPCRMGRLNLCKKKYEPIINQEGNLIYKAPVDWNKTLKLWHEDEEALQNKILIKNEPRSIVRIIYTKSNAIYNNKSFYYFSPNRTLKIRLNNKIKTEDITIFKY